MTLPATPRRAGPFLGNSASTAFPFAFKLFDAEDLQVVTAVAGAQYTLLLNSDYTVTLNADQDSTPGGTVTYPVSGSPLPTGGTLTIGGGLPYDQPTDIPDGGNFNPTALENALDRIEMQIQQVAEVQSRSFTFPLSEGAIPAFPAVSARANRLLGFDANGNFIGVLPTAGDATGLALDLANTAVPAKGDALIGMKRTAIGAVATNLHRYYERSVVQFTDFLTEDQCEDYRAGTHLYDLAGPLQAAIDACSSVTGTTVLGRALDLGSGSAKIGTMLNLTTSRVGGSLRRDGLKVFGRGRLATVLFCETGDLHAAIDATGSQWLTLEEFSIIPGATNKTTIGIFQGVSVVLNQTQNQTFSNLWIDLHDDHTANSGAGTVAIWNFGAEENTYHSVFLSANRALLLLGINNISSGIVAFPNSYQAPLQGAHSLGATSFTGTCHLETKGRWAPAVYSVDVNSVTMDNVYASNVGTGGTNNAFWTVSGGLYRPTLTLAIEGFGTLLDIYGAIDTGRVEVSTGDVIDTAAPFIEYHGGGQGQIKNSEIILVAIKSPSRPLMRMVPSAVTDKVTCYVNNTQFKTNLAADYLEMPENMRWNPLTVNVDIEGTLGFSYRINGNGTHTADILEVQVYPGTGRIAQVKMPTVVANAAAFGIGIEVEGMLFMSGGGTTNAQVAKQFRARFSAATAASNGVPVVSTVDMDAASTAAANVPGNNITAIAVSASFGSNLIGIFVTPTYVGGMAAPVRCKAVVRMTWGGGESVGPWLLVG